jgi:hypothetical protein
VLCSGLCGREGAGPVDSGGVFSPAEDARHSWCDSCWADLVVYRRMPAVLAKYVPAGTMIPFRPPSLSVPELSALPAARIEHKIVTSAEVKSVAMIAAAPVTGNGTFTGYLAAFGRDFGGDRLMPGSMDETAAALNSGAIRWHLTDSHSEKASDVVATVTAAVVDHYGLRIAGQWMPDETAQKLRQKVRSGAKLGLSIDYLTDASRPDGKGGRLLDRVTVVGGAVTPHPMNPGAFITESKYAASVPVVGLYDDAYAESRRRERDHPDLLRQDARIAAAGWIPPGLPRDLQLRLLDGLDAAQAKALAAASMTEGDRLLEARRDADNRYSNGLAAWMAAHR